MPELTPEVRAACGIMAELVARGRGITMLDMLPHIRAAVEAERERAAAYLESRAVVVERTGITVTPGALRNVAADIRTGEYDHA